jgi:hypothetical protein
MSKSTHIVILAAMILLTLNSVYNAIRQHHAELRFKPQQLDSLIMHWEASGAPMLINGPHAFVMYDTITKRVVLVPIAEEREKIMKLLDK